MNETEPTREGRGKHAAGQFPDIEHLMLQDSDPVVRARWDEGLRKWGDAFAAYATLATPELHTPDVLVNFEDVYIASFDSIEDFLHEQLDSLGWTDALNRLRREEGIPDDVLDWDHDALHVRVREVYDIVEKGGRIHVFSR